MARDANGAWIEEGDKATDTRASKHFWRSAMCRKDLHDECTAGLCECPCHRRTSRGGIEYEKTPTLATMPATSSILPYNSVSCCEGEHDRCALDHCECACHSLSNLCGHGNDPDKCALDDCARLRFIAGDDSEPEQVMTDLDGEPSLFTWWMNTAAADVKACIPKLEEYGSGDLLAIGDTLCRMIGWDDAPNRAKAEVGIAFYLLGKIERCMEAYAHQKLPSDDTYKDLVTYGMMVRRVRDIGAWR